MIPIEAGDKVTEKSCFKPTRQPVNLFVYSGMDLAFDKLGGGTGVNKGVFRGLNYPKACHVLYDKNLFK